MGKKINLLIIGHSHVACIRHAVEANPDIKGVYVVNTNKLTKKRSLKERLLRRKLREQQIVSNMNRQIEKFKPDAVCVCLGGNLHNLFGILENPTPFSVGEKLKGSTSPLSQNRAFIPRALMEEYFDSLIEKTLVSLIFENFPNAVRLYLNSPPPISDFSHIQKYPGVLQDKLDMGPPPNDLKMQLYQIQSNTLRNVAKKENATFVEVEPKLMDSEGFLNSDYYNQDPTHGNRAYGDVMLKKIINLAESAH